MMLNIFLIRFVCLSMEVMNMNSGIVVMFGLVINGKIWSGMMFSIMVLFIR